MSDDAATTTRSRANTRARLIEASSAVFAEKGLQGATVDDLAQAAGFTRGAFYSNFSSREELFFALFETVSEQMIALVNEHVARVTRADGDELAFVTRALDAVRPHAMPWYFLHTELTLYALRHPEANEFHARLRDHFSFDFTEVLSDALDRAGLVPVVEPEQLAATVLALFLHDLAEASLGGPENRQQPTIGDTVIPAMIRALTRPA